MTTDNLDVRLELLQSWPIFNGVPLESWLAVLSLETRSPSASFQGIAPVVVGAESNGDRTAYLIGAGPRFESTRRLSVALAERRGVWSEPSANHSTVPGVPLRERRLGHSPVDAVLAVTRLGSEDVEAAFDISRMSAAVILISSRPDVEDWACSVLSSVLEHPFATDELFVDGTRALRKDELLLRGVGLFGDPVGMDIVGEHSHLAAIQRRIAPEPTRGAPG